MLLNATEFNYVNKSPRVLKAITKIKSLRAVLVGRASKRQIELYDAYIKILEHMPETHSLQNIKDLTNFVYGAMLCHSGEIECQAYHTVFDSIDNMIKFLISDEIDERLCTMIRSTRNKYIQRAIDAGLMDENEMWIEDKITKARIAYFMEFFAEKNPEVGENKWAYAKERWGLTNLAQARSNSINNAGKVVGGEIIEKIFED